MSRKRGSRFSSLALYAIVIAIVWADQYYKDLEQSKFEDALKKEIELDKKIDEALLADANKASSKTQGADNQESVQSGTVIDLTSSRPFTTQQLWTQVRSMPINTQGSFLLWSNQHSSFTGSGMGIDNNHYFVNSYLLGYMPFYTDAVWKPLATLALKKSYAFDTKLYGARYKDVWQNSQQAYKLTRGDCEDHSIILADWLISLGHNARVVLGEFRNGGHAWVVLFKDDKEYILEATSKGRIRGTHNFINAALATKYKPIYQFDRRHFWVNTGSKHTTKYGDSKWVKKSSYSS